MTNILFKIHHIFYEFIKDPESKTRIQYENRLSI